MFIDTRLQNDNDRYTVHDMLSRFQKRMCQIRDGVELPQALFGVQKLNLTLQYTFRLYQHEVKATVAYMKCFLHQLPTTSRRPRQDHGLLGYTILV